MSYIENPVPRWEIGDWWIIETCFIANISEKRHGPEKLGIKCFHHIYEVFAEQNINGKDVWVIDVKATKLPSEIANDHGNNHLWRLHLDKGNLSLIRFTMNIRSGGYLVTGKEVIHKVFDYKKSNPVIIGNVPVLTPIDIPLLPSGGFPRFLSEDEKELEFLDENNYQKYFQYITAIQERVNDKIINVLYVKLYNENLGVRTQRWVPGLPWWQEWRYATTERFTDGMWYAKLINWNGDKAN